MPLGRRRAHSHQLERDSEKVRDRESKLRAADSEDEGGRQKRKASELARQADQQVGHGREGQGLDPHMDPYGQGAEKQKC